MLQDLKPYLRSYSFQKLLVGLGGLGLASFVLLHMLGNLSLLLGAKAYNQLSFSMTSNPLFELAEVGLLSLFLLHVIFAILLNLKNNAARNKPYNYKSSSPGEKHTHWIHKSLIPQGVILFVFIILHLLQFKWGDSYWVTYDGVKMRDFFTMVVSFFQNIYSLLFYCLSILVLGVHLKSGLCASLQSLGIAAADSPWLQKIGLAYAVTVTLGFLCVPLYIYFIY